MILNTLRLLALSLLPAALADRTFYINNACPADIVLYINADIQGTIPKGTGVIRTFPTNFTGLVYSSSNGGSGAGTRVTSAGFHLDGGYYYILKDPSHFNMGVSITPHATASSGFCGEALCDSIDCKNAFPLSQIPTHFPLPVIKPSAPPMFSCTGPNVGFTIAFCPSLKFPPESNVRIHPIANANKCLDVRGNALANGTPVQIYDCNGTGAQNWIINAGSTKVQLAGTNFCLDAGSTPGNGIGMKIWQCYDNLPAQQWYLTGDNRIALEGKGQCLDLTNGNLANSNQVQTWQCTDNNNNQAWIRS